MEKEFDFNSVGKRIPYQVPNTFFSNVTEQTLGIVHRRKKATLYKVVFGLLVGVAAMLAFIFTIGTFDKKDSVENKEQMSIAAIQKAQPAVNKHLTAVNDSKIAQSFVAPTKLPKAVIKVKKEINIDDWLAEVSDNDLDEFVTAVETDTFHSQF